MIKLNTIEQFKILQHIQKIFYSDTVKISIVDESSLMVTDVNQKSMIFRWDGTEVIAEESDS